MAAPLKTMKLPGVTLMSCLQAAGPSHCYSFLFQPILHAALYDFVFLFVVN